MKKIFVIIAAILLSSVLKAQNELKITAKLSGFPDGAKFYLQNSEFQADIDSAVLKNGTFQMKGNLADVPVGLYLSATVDKKDYWCYLFVGNENVVIKGDKKDFPFYVTVTGSKFQDELQVLNNQTRDLFKRRSELTQYWVQNLMNDTTESAQHASDSIRQKLIRPIDRATDSIRMAFIKAHFNSYIGMNALFFVRNSFKKDTLQKMYDGLSAEHKESIYGQRIKNYLIVGDALKNGDKYSDFEAMDTSGKKHKLSDFTGKYVLLDFTQTYCEPCIESVDELKKADSLYKNKLQLISFNADKSKERWLTGILRDKPTWIALWDGEGIYGKTILKYNVTGYPTFVLLNPEGKIIWKEFGFETGIIEKALEKNVQ